MMKPKQLIKELKEMKENETKIYDDVTVIKKIHYINDNTYYKWEVECERIKNSTYYPYYAESELEKIAEIILYIK